MPETERPQSGLARRIVSGVKTFWRRPPVSLAPTGEVALTAVTQRLDLLLNALFGRSYRLREAQPPTPPRFLEQLLGHRGTPWPRAAVPATNGSDIWLPGRLDLGSQTDSLVRYRTLALLQGTRAARGSAAHLQELDDPQRRSLYLLLEAWAAETELFRRLPGLAVPLRALRRDALAQRPPLTDFAPPNQPLEGLLRLLLATPCGESLHGLLPPTTPNDSLQLANRLAESLLQPGRSGTEPLLHDSWTGNLHLPEAPPVMAEVAETQSSSPPFPDRHRLHAPPQDRQPSDGTNPGAPLWQSHRQAEPPPQPYLAEQTGAPGKVADARAVSERRCLAAATRRLPECLAEREGPPAARILVPDERPSETAQVYPEWNFRSRSYLVPGATVHLCPAESGSQDWVVRTLESHRLLIKAVRRPFERLRAQRLRLRRQLDGDDIDLDAYIDALAQAHAGQGMSQAVYQLQRSSRRDLAVLLLVDISGSTDNWLSSQRRIIDVEREALLLVCQALQDLGEPYAAQAFSGVGPQSVQLRSLKDFAERYDDAVARRIAALEPEFYTRTGAAIRHASACLRSQPAQHRLLLLLSDGKPNDVDKYAGRYGMEDTRQALNEARLCGIQPFCLTIDRQAADYLPVLFGPRRYALLPEPERLPGVLLEWIGRLLAG